MNGTLTLLVLEVAIMVSMALILHAAVQRGKLPQELWKAMLIKRALILLILLSCVLPTSDNPRLERIGGWAVVGSVFTYFAYSVYFHIRFRKMRRAWNDDLAAWARETRATSALDVASNASLRASTWTRLYGDRR